METLSSYEGHVVPDENNAAKILLEVAHHQLVQKPAFVFECWGPFLQDHLAPFVGHNLDKLYSELYPTTRGVLNALVIPEPKSIEEKKVLDNLKKYIKNCNQLELFLRFCTGSNLLIGKQITVHVVAPMNDFQRRPIAHTCGCELHISESYGRFADLRGDFDRILDSKVLTMNIV